MRWPTGLRIAQVTDEITIENSPVYGYGTWGVVSEHTLLDVLTEERICLINTSSTGGCSIGRIAFLSRAHSADITCKECFAMSAL